MTDAELGALLGAAALPPALEQQPDEPALAYAAFLLYVTLGRRRSIRAVAEQDGHAERHTERWASRFHWTERLALFERVRLRAAPRALLREAVREANAG